MTSEGAKWTDLGGLAAELQKTETPGEALLLVALWSKRDGWRPRAQHPVGRYRIDLAIPEVKIAVESDGHRFHSTNTQLEADAERQNALVAEGWTPLRFSAAQAYLKPAEIAQQIVREIRKRQKSEPARAAARPIDPEPPPLSREEIAARTQQLLDALKTSSVSDNIPIVPRRRNVGGI